MTITLDFEKPIQELEGKIEELRRLDGRDGMELKEEIKRLQEKVDKQIKVTYKDLTAWQKTQVARHPERPHFTNYIKGLVEDFMPLAGDRRFGEDKAIIGGIGRFKGRSVMFIGHEKGRTTEDRVRHNFGMARPEGYRKAVRLMEMADKFGLPVVTLIDTAGAFPGIQAEERGQAQAIAASTEACLALGVPMVSVVVGEGGSGGAIALASANTVLMMEHSIYSVISPEGCASILWRSAEKAADAAEALKLTAKDLLELRIIDAVIPEPAGGAHRQQKDAVQSVGDAIHSALTPLEAMDAASLKKHRRDKFIEMGRVLS